MCNRFCFSLSGHREAVRLSALWQAAEHFCEDDQFHLVSVPSDYYDKYLAHLKRRSAGSCSARPSDTNPRTIQNFPIQSTGNEILHVACILAERRGIKLVAPIHDALLAEGDLDHAEDLSLALDRLGDAAAVVLRGYRLPTNFQIIRPGQRYYDERGFRM